MLRAANLADFPHGFSERSDACPAILPSFPLLLARQVHSPTVVVAAAWGRNPPQADAIVTDKPGWVIGIVTADCAPVLLADGEAGVVGAAHAGWRGAVDGVLENTIAAMERLGAQRVNIAAAIGPTIAQSNYEVDGAMRRKFAEDDQPFFVPGASGRWQFDLPGFVAARLRAAGIESIEDLREDTYAQPERFYSYRRATHRGEPTGGRQTSSITLL